MSITAPPSPAIATCEQTIPSSRPQVDDLGDHQDSRLIYQLVITVLSVAATSTALLAGIGPEGLALVTQIWLLAFLIIAAWIDTRERIIPNRLTYNLILSGLSINAVDTLSGADAVSGLIGFWPALYGAMICFSLMFMLFMVNATGGGDVKLAAALGAFLGADVGLTAIAWCHLLAGGFALLWLVSRLPLASTWNRLNQFAQEAFICRHLPRIALPVDALANQRIPMAAFFLLGVIVTRLGFQLW